MALYHDLSADFAPFTRAATAVSSYAKRAEGHLFLYLIFGDHIDREKFFKRLSSLDAEVLNVEQHLLGPEQKNTVAEIRLQTENLLKQGEALLAEYDSNPESFDLSDHKALVLQFHNSSSSIRKNGVALNDRKADVFASRVGQVIKTLDRYKQSILSWMLIVVAVAAWLSFILSRSISRPIIALMETAARIGKGDFRQRIDVETEDEIGKLSTSFNEMMEHLEEVTVSRDHLNKEVRHRQEIEGALRVSEARLSAIFEHASDAIILIDPIDTRFATFNKNACIAFGYTSEEFSRLSISDISPRDTPEEMKKHFDLASVKGSHSFQTRCRIKGGGIRHFQINVRLISLQGESCLLSAMRDVTEIKEAAEFQRLSNAVFDVATEGIIITDSDREILTINPAFTEITGYTAEDVIGKTPRILQSGKHDKAFYQAMWDRVNGTGFWQGEIWNRRKNGEIYPVWLSITAIKDEQGNLTQYTGLFNDITQQKNDQEQLQFQAHYDALTNLPNRILCIERLSQAIKLTRRNNSKAAILFVDLDGFKQVNDTYGHLAGDQVLMDVASRLLTCVREVDTVSRLGGDEFLVILTEISNRKESLIVAEKILKKISGPFSVAEHEAFIGASIGISLSPDDGEEPMVLFQKADMAMYVAKGSGRNMYHFFREEIAKESTLKTLMEWDLKRAVENQEMRMCYQPVIDLKTGEVFSFEALIRWDHPDKGIIMPEKFIPIAEKTRLISEISAWVIITVCSQIKKWQDRFGPDIAVSINLSSRDLLASETLSLMTKALEENELSPKSLMIEITERSMIDQENRDVYSKLEAIQAAGIRISVDDFGTGYSSLSSLAKYPIDILKIDQSFVRNVGSDPKKQPIVDAIIQMGKSLDLEIIAEGVESHKDSAYLLEIGCDKGQGYHFSKPLSAKECEKILEKRNIGS